MDGAGARVRCTIQTDYEGVNTKRAVEPTQMMLASDPMCGLRACALLCFSLRRPIKHRANLPV
jgi:hypothetical protein